MKWPRLQARTKDRVHATQIFNISESPSLHFNRLVDIGVCTVHEYNGLTTQSLILYENSWLGKCRQHAWSVQQTELKGTVGKLNCALGH